MLSRRDMLIALAAAVGYKGLPTRALGALPAGARRVAVVFPSGLEPCAEAVEGLRQRLSGSDLALDLLDVGNAAFPAEAAQAFARKPSVIVAVGSEALRTVAGRDSQAKTISTMTLQADRDSGAALARGVNAAVYLDIPIQYQVAELRKLFPDRARIGMIRNPNRGGETSAQLHSQADTNSLQIADCATPEELLPAFLSFRKRADFIICLPDSSLYNGATARPLIMASLENRLPIVGFSPAFLRAGAAVAIFPDYRGVGLQTAELVRRCLDAGECSGSERPRKVNVAVNAKVLRMLGIDFRAGANPDLVILR